MSRWHAWCTVTLFMLSGFIGIYYLTTLWFGPDPSWWRFLVSIPLCILLIGTGEGFRELLSKPKS